MQRPLYRALAGAAALVLAAGTVQAQVGQLSNTATVTLNATKASTLTVTPSTGTATLASITDNSNANVFSAVSLQTDWNLTAGTSVRLMGWFTTPASALTNGSAVIPTANVEGGINGGGWSAFTGAAVGGVGVAGGSLQLFSQPVAAANYFGTRSDALNLRLNLVGYPTTTAGLYTGTLNVQAVVQ
ncbi:MAG TPA: hypothetical protein VM347_21990 [Nonomuraea sp.]|jgi:hypothetical protein|nr:hypothetical protein [Nonomuraea sp.]